MPQPTNATNQLDLHKNLHNAVVDVRSFGAVGDGSTDDTAAIQAAIDAAVGGSAGAAPVPTRFGVAGTGVVRLPAGRFKITAALRFYGVQGLTFRGAGPKATYLYVSGALTHALDIVGATHCTFEGFQITAVDQSYSGTNGSVTDSVIRLDWTPAETAGSSNSAEFRWVLINSLQFKDGFGIGVNSPAYDVADIRFTHCAVTGNRTFGSADTTKWQAAFRLGNGTFGNVLNHYLEFCHLSTMRYGVNVNAVASVALDHTDCSLLDMYAYAVTSGVLAIRDVRMENVPVIADGGAGGIHYPGSLVLDNVQLTGTSTYEDPNGRVVRWRQGGAVHITNSQILGVNFIPKVYTDSLEPVTISISDTVWKLATAATDLYEVNSGSAYLDVTNVTLLDSGGSVSGRIPKATTGANVELLLPADVAAHGVFSTQGYSAPFSGTADPILAIGYNQLSGGRRSTSYASIWTAYEADYNDGTNHLQEWYVQHVGTGGVASRPFATTVNSAGATTRSDVTVQPGGALGSFQVLDAAGASLFVVNAGNGQVGIAKSGASLVFTNTNQYIQATAANDFAIICNGGYVWVGNGTNGLLFGSGKDTNLYRSAANVLKTDDQLLAVDGVQTKYLSGAGKTTVVDGDFTATPTNGAVAVHWDTTASRAYLSVRANGTWHVMAGPVA